jgi:hypothetical protein
VEGGRQCPRCLESISLQLGGNHGREIFPEARGTSSLDIAEYKFSKRELAIFHAGWENFGAKIFSNLLLGQCRQ